MKKQLVIIGIIVLLVNIALSGCEGNHSLDFLFLSDRDKLAGGWGTNQSLPNQENPRTFWDYSPEYQFFSNGIVHAFNWVINGTWDIKDGKLIIIYNTSLVNGTYTYEYTFLENNVLKLLKIPSENQTPVVYKKYE